MRVSDRQKKHWINPISQGAILAVVLSGVATPVMADELVQTLPNLWVSATALSLALAAAAGRPKK